MARADTAEALKRAAFRLVELTDASWPGPRGVGGGTMTFPEYRDEIGPQSSITLCFGEISDTDPWVYVDSTWPGEYGRRDAGNGFVQIFTFDDPPEGKARWGVEAAASFSNAIARLKRGAEATPFLSDDERDAIKRAPATTVELALDGEPVAFTLVRSLGVTAASANFADRTVTVWGRFEPEQIELQTVADLDRYLT